MDQIHRNIKQRYYTMLGFGRFDSASQFRTTFDELRNYLRVEQVGDKRTISAYRRQIFIGKWTTRVAELAAPMPRRILLQRSYAPGCDLSSGRTGKARSSWSSGGLAWVVSGWLPRVLQAFSQRLKVDLQRLQSQICCWANFLSLPVALSAARSGSVTLATRRIDRQISRQPATG